MRRLQALLAAGLVATAPLPLRAQERTCELLPGATEAVRVLGDAGEEVLRIRGRAHWVCSGGVVVQADSTLWSADRGELELIGDVFYGDSVKTLRAQWVRYAGREERVLARDGVVLTDRNSGSVIRGPELEYERETPDRPRSRTIVRGRPHAVFYPADSARAGPADPGAVPGDTAAQPLVVDADRMEIFDESSFRASGDVELARGGTRGFGRDAEFDQASEHLLLTGDARIEDEQFTLLGERIEGFLSDQELRDVIAYGDAVLLGEELRVDAPELRIFFETGELRRLVARPGDVGAGLASATSAAADGLRARALASDFRLVADSLDALAPAQRLERVIAVGDAYSERIDGPDEELATGLPDFASRDWLRGDTIIGYFRTDTVPVARAGSAGGATGTGRSSSAGGATAADSVRLEPVLERIVALGGEDDAQSVYRIRGEDGGPETPSINYVAARRITLFLTEGEVREVEAEGPIRGIHLQPRPSEPGDEEPGTGAAPQATPGSSGPYIEAR